MSEFASLDDSLGIFRRCNRSHTGLLIVLHVSNWLRHGFESSKLLNSVSFTFTCSSSSAVEGQEAVFISASSNMCGSSIAADLVESSSGPLVYKVVAETVSVVFARLVPGARASAGSAIGGASRAGVALRSGVSSDTLTASVMFARRLSRASTDSQLSGLESTGASRDSCALHGENITGALLGKVLNHHRLGGSNRDGGDHGLTGSSSSIDGAGFDTSIDHASRLRVYNRELEF